MVIPYFEEKPIGFRWVHQLHRWSERSRTTGQQFSGGDNASGSQWGVRVLCGNTGRAVPTRL